MCINDTHGEAVLLNSVQNRSLAVSDLFPKFHTIHQFLYIVLPHIKGATKFYIFLPRIKGATKFTFVADTNYFCVCHKSTWKPNQHSRLLFLEMNLHFETSD